MPVDRAVLTLANFVAALIVSWVVVYAIYGLTLLAVRSVWWTIRVVTAHAGGGAELVVVHPVRWMVRRLARLGETLIQSARRSLYQGSYLNIIGLRSGDRRTNAQTYCSNTHVDR